MADFDDLTTDEPCFTATTSSTRSIYLLLRCIGFQPMAQVQLTSEGIRVSVEDSRSMQGHAFLDQSLFSSFKFTPGPSFQTQEDVDSEDPEDNSVSFGISLAALLECLQIFGAESRVSDSAKWNSASSGVSTFASRTGGAGGMFSAGPLHASGICRLIYAGVGSPLCVILTEGGVTTTCQLTTYDPDAQEDIPLDRDALAQKIIMKAAWLHDAIVELDSTSAEILIIHTTPVKPYFALSSVGYLGSASVEFSNERGLMEVFNVESPSTNRYRFSMIKSAIRAMSMASKVSLRGDTNGVLSLQFMIELEGNNNPVFIDFRFLPQLETDSDEDEDDKEGKS